MKQFNEQDHPRASDGKFTSKGGESSNTKDLQKDIDVEEVEVNEVDTQERIFDGHVSYISEKTRGGTEGITFDEAEYINAILNMKVCELYIINSVSLRSIGTRFNIRIPKYQATQPFKTFIEKHNSNSNSTSAIEKDYFELLNTIGWLEIQ